MLFFNDGILRSLGERESGLWRSDSSNKLMMNKKMKIVLFNTFYYPKLVGGAEISVQLLAEELVRNGHQVYVFTIGKKEEIARINGVIVIRLTSKNISSVYDSRKHGFFATTVWLMLDSMNPLYHFKLSYLLKRIRPDV